MEEFPINIVNEEQDLPEIDAPDWDWGVVLPLIPDKVQKVAYFVLAILGFVVATVAGVFRSLYSSLLISHEAAFLAVTIASIVLGIVSSLTAILGYNNLRKSEVVVPEKELDNLESVRIQKDEQV